MNGYIQPNLFTKKRLLYGIMVQHISLKLSWNKKNRTFGSFDPLNDLHFVLVQLYFVFLAFFFYFIFLKQERNGEGTIKRVPMREEGRRVSSL